MEGWALKLMWLLLFVAACALFGLQVQSLVDKYLRYGKKTSVKVSVRKRPCQEEQSPLHAPRMEETHRGEYSHNGASII